MKPHQLLFRGNPADSPKTTNILMLITALLVVLFFVWLSRAGAARIIINGAYITLNGGTSATPVHLVIDTLSTAGITRNSGHIISEGEYNKVQWNVRLGTGAYTFPIGRTTATYIPFVFNKTTAGTESGTGTVRASSWFTLNNATLPNGTILCSPPSDESYAADRFWVIDVLNYSANPTATIRFSYEDPGDLDGIAETELQAQRWNSASVDNCKWTLPSVGTVDAVNNYVEVTTSVFSPWVLVGKNTPLPIELLYFTAQWYDNEQTKVLLEWQTATEINNDYFEMQRSTDAVNFTAMGTKKGAGNSNQLLTYSKYDTEPIKDKTSYYRLKQVDYDGNYTFSNIEVINPANKIDIIVIYPNPSSSDEIEFLLYVSYDTGIEIFVINALSQNVYRKNTTAKKGIHKMSIPSYLLSTGNYILQIKSDEFVTTTQKQFMVN